MKLKYKLFIFSFFIFSTFQLSAQLDDKSGSKEKIKVKSITLNSSKSTKKPTSLKNNNNGFKDAYKKEKEKQKKQQAEKAFENKGVITKELARKIKFQKFIEQNTIQMPMIDKDIGVFRTKSKFIYLNAFDFSKIDGDKIAILKNDKTFLTSFYLFNEHKTKTIEIPLDKGFNKIEILAIDEGSMRPNTGAFSMFDDEKKEVFSDLWHLAKGAKVIAHIIRE
ncbi:MAG: hypothetical protein ABJH82_04420 [Polaribacter sp.]|uniref:hypothetical protein n=1 Tax=Polaribacter sp. TaxID=1920175 RepID=UPI003266ACDA